MVSAMLLVLRDLALREATAREYVQLVLGHTTTDATEFAPLSLQLLMPVSRLVLVELHLSMEFAKSVLSHVLQASSSILRQPHADLVNILALSVP